MVIRKATGTAVGPGDILWAIRETGPLTRAELSETLGLARSSVAQRVDALLAGGLVIEADERRSTGGRPPTSLVFNAAAGAVLAADLGVTHGRLAVCDLGGELLADLPVELPIDLGPDEVLAETVQGFEELLAEVDVDAAAVRAIGLGLPGPVEHALGRAASPPLMPGWDGFDVPARVRERFDVPVLVDNDVNIMALGEHAARGLQTCSLLFIKVATGIGCGIVVDGRLFRGAQGAAGDIGHIRVGGHDDVVCHCGNHGCLEAVAGGSALAERLRAAGRDATGARDVVRLARTRDREAVRLVRQAGRLLGEVIAGLVNSLNPDVIVIGGDLAGAYDEIVAGARELTYQRSTPLATRELELVLSQLGDRAGVLGAARLAVSHVLTPEFVDAVLVRFVEP